MKRAFHLLSVGIYVIVLSLYPASGWAKENSKIMKHLSENLQISGGVDGRLEWKESHSVRPELAGMFLNLRKVFRDELGDRWIVSLQGDADDTFEKFRSYQSFLQYKGPLGKWNIRAGHYILPFGLLHNYDTERLIFQTAEEETLGIKLDSGVQAFGYFGDWDWNVSLSEGIGRRWFDEWDDNFLVTTRLGWNGGTWKAGISTFTGRVKTSEEFSLGEKNLEQQKVGIDWTREAGPWVIRAEGLGGLEDHQGMGGGLLLVDYALTDRFEINTKYALTGRSEIEQEAGAGFTFKLGKGWILRAGYFLNANEDEIRNEFQAQLYYDFSRHL